jgi:hypothetical protein
MARAPNRNVAGRISAPLNPLWAIRTSGFGCRLSAPGQMGRWPKNPARFARHPSPEARRRRPRSAHNLVWPESNGCGDSEGISPIPAMRLGPIVARMQELADERRATLGAYQGAVMRDIVGLVRSSCKARYLPIALGRLTASLFLALVLAAVVSVFTDGRAFAQVNPADQALADPNACWIEEVRSVDRWGGYSNVYHPTSGGVLPPLSPKLSKYAGGYLWGTAGGGTTIYPPSAHGGTSSSPSGCAVCHARWGWPPCQVSTGPD